MFEFVTVEPEETLVSPRFEARYPTVKNRDLLDPGALAAMEESWMRGVFPEKPVEIFRLHDVFLINEDMVFDRDMRFIKNVSDECTAEEISNASRIIRSQVQSGRIPYLAGRSILARRRAGSNYGHFMLEVLPILHVSKLSSETGQARILLMHAEPSTMDSMFRALRLAGHDLRRTLMSGYREPLACSELLVVRGLTRHGRYMSSLAVDACTQIAQPIPPGNTARIFVKRIAGHLRSGVLRNEAELCEQLQEVGFHILDPGSLPLEEQITIFKGAQQVVGIIGAAMTNIAFCTPGTKITMLCASQFPDVFFWFIAQHRKLDYTEVRGRTVPVPDMPSWAGDFVLDSKDIAWLRAEAGPPARDRMQFERMRIIPTTTFAGSPNIRKSRLVPA